MQLYSRAWEELSWQFFSQDKYPSVEENARTGIGFLLRKIWQVYTSIRKALVPQWSYLLFQNMNDSISGASQRKFLLYSGHDTTCELEHYYYCSRQLYRMYILLSVSLQ